MKIQKLSSSSYSCEEWCEWKWFLTYVLGLEDVSGASAAAGRMGHLLLEECSKVAMENGNVDVEELAIKVFNQSSSEDTVGFSELKGDKIRKITRGIQKLFEGEYSPFNANTIEIEKYFKIELKEDRFKLPGTSDEYFKITGLIDRIDKISDDTLEIIDYKTGMRKDFGKADNGKIDVYKLKDMIQPAMYHLAASELFPEYNNFLITYIYVVDGGPISVPFDESDIVKTKQKIYDKMLKIRNNNSPQRDISWKCKRLCWFGKSGTCQTVWNEKEEVGQELVELKYSVLKDRKR